MKISKKPSSYNKVTTIYAKLVRLDRQVQMHCLYPHPQFDVVQINAPKYDSDIDGETDLLPDIQSATASHTASTAEESSNAENIQEDTVSEATNSEEYTASLQNTDRPESQSPSIPDNTDHLVHQDPKQPRTEHPNDYRPQLEDIPELGDNEENWEEGQFVDADFIDHHNTIEKSDKIHHEYSAHFGKVTDQGYSYHNNRMPGLEYQIPEPDIIILTHNQNNIRGIKIQMYISLPHHLLKICADGMVMAMGELNISSCIAIGCMGRKQDL